MREDEANSVFSNVFYGVQRSIVAALDAALLECSSLERDATSVLEMHGAIVNKAAIEDDAAAMKAICDYSRKRATTIKAIKANFASLTNKSQKDAVYRLAFQQFEVEHPSVFEFTDGVASRKQALKDACYALDEKYGYHRPFVLTDSTPVIVLGKVTIGKANFVRLEADIDEPGQREGLFLIEEDRIPFRSGCVDLWRDKNDYDTVGCDDRNLRVHRGESITGAEVPAEGTLERNLLDDFIDVLESCRTPRSKWKEDLITAGLVDAIERRAEDSIKYGDAYAVIDYGAFKQSGAPEQKYGDICLIVGTNDGVSKKAWVCYIEAKKVHDIAKSIGDIRHAQMDRIKSSGVPTYILVYDLWVPPLWQMAIMPVDEYLAQPRLTRPNVTDIGKPLSWQMVNVFFRGKGMAGSEKALQDAAGSARLFASNIVYVRGGVSRDYTIAREFCHELPDRWERMLELALRGFEIERDRYQFHEHDIGDDFDHDISYDFEHDIGDDFDHEIEGPDISDNFGRSIGDDRGGRGL